MSERQFQGKISVSATINYWTNVSLLIKLEKLDRGSILDNKSDGHAR
jgi:hypothetical protein